MPSIDLSEAGMWQQTLLPAGWPASPRISAFTTLRGPAGASLPPFDRCNFGMGSGDDLKTVARNRADLTAHLELPPPRWLQQVHGINVARFNDVAPMIELEADASVTSMSSIALAILTADCLPVLFCNTDGDEVGAAHAGWRGLVAGVLENTVAAMRTPPERLLAWLGPAAGPQAYEVGEEVRDAFVSHDQDAAAMFVATRPGHWLIDLYGLARLRLVQSGMSRNAIHGGGLCTISDPQRFYSYRRDGQTGRMASLIWINP